MATETKGDLAHLKQAKAMRTPSSDSTYVLDPHEEKRITRSILWKLDTRMLPMLALLFLFSFLDRSVTSNHYEAR